MNKNEEIIKQTTDWLNSVVIGLNLCPFAAKPFKNKNIRLALSHATDDEGIIKDLEAEIERLNIYNTKNNSGYIETTVLIIPNSLSDFFDYNQFLDRAENLIKQQNLTGIYQIASFHPNYQFGGTLPEDAENLTNRSPYPILHIIREESIEMVLSKFPNADKIPTNNINTVENLTAQQRSALFPFLKENH